VGTATMKAEIARIAELGSLRPIIFDIDVPERGEVPRLLPSKPHSQTVSAETAHAMISPSSVR
jgi:hypothetical protein